MRVILVILATWVAMPAAAQDRPPAFTNAEACVRDNVAAAVAASSGAKDAADFLLDYLCAASVGAASAYERNMAGLAAFRQMETRMGTIADYAAGQTDNAQDPDPAAPVESPFGFGAWMDDISVDPVTGDYVVDAGSDGIMVDVLRSHTAQMGLYGTTVPLFLRELTGRLILEHRR